jgi:hypothetical protein
MCYIKHTNNTKGEKMKKLILAAFLMSISLQSFALFVSKMPDKIVCDNTGFCNVAEDKYKISGWVFTSSSHGLLKPGTYYFTRTFLYGNPNDNFIKNVNFEYIMVDNDGYKYYASYETENWVVPENRSKYESNQYGATCESNTVSDCYVTLIAPQK